jgi:hypothetical protein
MLGDCEHEGKSKKSCVTLGGREGERADDKADES